MKNSAGPVDLQKGLQGVQARFLLIRDATWGLACISLILEVRRLCFDTNRTLDGVLSIHSFNVITGIKFGGFIVFQGTSRTRKTMKIVVLSFKIEDRQKDIRNEIQRSPGSIFHEFVVVLGAMAVILDVFGSSVLEVKFQGDSTVWLSGSEIQRL